jgi:regulation of enolase protein 1 (concanavalin A-like superfamily)
MDGKRWSLTRAFNLAPERQLQFWFSAQSPPGTGSTVTFSEIHYKPEPLKPWTGE